MSERTLVKVEVLRYAPDTNEYDCVLTRLCVSAETAVQPALNSSYAIPVLAAYSSATVEERVTLSADSYELLVKELRESCSR